jgi:hypothetical protein
VYGIGTDCLGNKATIAGQVDDAFEFVVSKTRFCAVQLGEIIGRSTAGEFIWTTSKVWPLEKTKD